MRDELADNGLNIKGLWLMAWALGAIAFGSFMRLLTYAGDDARVQPELLVWMLIGTRAGAFSASCAVLVGVKSAEQRLVQRSDTFRS